MLGIPHVMLAATSAVLLSTVALAAEKKPPFKIPQITSYTGASMAPYLPAGQGFEAFVEYTNRNGGINGRLIELQVLDDQSSTSIGSALFQSAVASSPLAIVHLSLSTILTQAKSTLANAPIAVLTSSADDSLLYPSPAKNVFMMNASAKQQAKAWIGHVERVIGSLKGKKIAMALAQTAYFDSMISTVRQMATEKGYDVVLVERFNLGIPSFSSQSARIARLNPDAVLVAAIAGDVPIVVNGVTNAGVTTAPIVGFSAISSNEVFQKLNLSNYYAFRPFKLGTDVPELSAKADGRYAGSMAGSNWTLGWSTAEVLAHALGRCGDGCTGEKLIEILESGEPVRAGDDVLYGPVVFSKTNHAGLTAVQTYKLDVGRVVPAGEPISIAD